MCSSRNCRKCVKGAKLCGFCSAHLCKLLQGRNNIRNLPARFCSVHLCKLLHHSRYRPYSYHKLLLCALVQVASKTAITNNQKIIFCSVHLCKLLQNITYKGRSFIKLLLCALVQVASSPKHAKSPSSRPSALCTCASCFKILPTRAGAS